MSSSTYSVWLEGFGWDIENVNRNRALEVAEELLDEGFTVSEVRLYKDKERRARAYEMQNKKGT